MLRKCKKVTKIGEFQEKRKNQKKPIFSNKIELESSKTGILHNFKIYAEDELGWPIQSQIIQDSIAYKPKNGESKRVS